MRKRITMELDRSNIRSPCPSITRIREVAMEVASRLGSFFDRREHQEPRSDHPGNLEVSRIPTGGNPEKTRGAGGQAQTVQDSSSAASCPQQEQANLSGWQRLQDQIKNNSDAIARLEDRKVFIESQISNIERESPGAANPATSPWQAVGSSGAARPRAIALDRTGHANERNWKNCTRNTPRFTRPWCRRVARWNNWKRGSRFCANPDLPPRRPGRRSLDAAELAKATRCSVCANRSPRSTSRSSRKEKGDRRDEPDDRSDPVQGGTVAATGAGDDLPVARLR